MALLSLFKSDPLKDAAFAMYGVAATQARSPGFYTDMAVADDFDGRFDLLVIHVHLLIRRLRGLSGDSKKAQQRLFDVFMRDLDQGLRLQGVGDIGIGHRVKKMTHAYYGRAVAYDAALDEGDGDALAAAIRRNLYREGPVSEPVLEAMTAYVTAQDVRLGELGEDAVLAGDLAFPPPPEGGVHE
ncbi:ubiquinol-cytochrome C chaperone family protein [Minwuia sp.]|uniref:ubiquinol-cytochrome C chaperone family protein n=1 Tax=Minwuia sp. TaxID=2493630 RepID=UPI003A8E2BCF